MKRPSRPITRRRFFKQAGSAVAAATCLPAFIVHADATSRQATGTRAGEITSNSAIVWTRLTLAMARNNEGASIDDAPPEQLPGACPGAPGRVRLRFGTTADLKDATKTDWADVTEATDFIHHFSLSRLNPGATYHYESETAGADGKPHGVCRGEFRTAPAADAPSDLQFCVMTCQGYSDRGHDDGHPIYPAMLALKPAFACLTGDLVYYDNDAPRAESPQLARYHWQRMFSLPRLLEFNRLTGAYWLKDDHDTLNNDSWPGKKMGTFTFDEGQRIFRQQAPMSNGPGYRTFRWGRDLQIWLAEGRDFRSPNTMPDGPEKTIWGKEQKAWFQRTLKESDATWKVLVSPTPLVGPDRSTGKSDNHSNKGFQHEGDELREWFKANLPENFFVICGDRHWQYHSVHPQTGLHEFSVGPASNEHASGSPGENPQYHRFHRVQGGFLSVALKSDGPKSTILFQHRNVNGEVAYEWSAVRSAKA